LKRLVLLACVAAFLPVAGGVVLGGTQGVAGGGPALQRLADELYRRLEKVLQETGASDPTLAVVVEGDNSILGKEGRITQELERLLIYRMDSGAVVGRALPLGVGGVKAAEEARSRGAALLLRCIVGVEQGTIHVTADLTPLHVPFWDRLVDPVPRGAKEHLFVSTRADEEILLLLGKSRAPPPLKSWHLSELLYVPRRVLDLGFGDLDGDGSSELVLLYEDAIEVYSLKEVTAGRGGAPRRLATHSLSHLPEAEVRVRDPMGSLLVADFNQDGRFEVFCKLFDRRVGQILSWVGSDLRPIRKLQKVPLCVYREKQRARIVYGEPDPGTNQYLPQVEVADINRSSGKVHTLPGAFLTLRCWQSEPDQAPWMVVVDLAGRMFRLDAAFKARPLQEGVGAGAGVANLDRDEDPELIASEWVWPGQPDGIRVVSHSEILWQTREVIGSVVAVAGGRFAAGGQTQALLAAVEPSESASRIYLLGR
jgi:hypothetical protein